MILLSVVISAGAQSADVHTGGPYTSIADWSKTYNPGAYNEVIFSNAGATEGSREGCDASSSTKTTTISLTSSDTQWLDVNVPSTAASTIAKLVFMVVGNSSSSTGWDHQVWASESVPFDVTKAKQIDFHFYGYKSGNCTPFDLAMPAGTKSIRIYRKTKSTANGDGTFTLGSGTSIGSGQTMHFHYFDVYLVTGPKIMNLSVAGTDADAIDHSAKTIHVTVPFATNLSSVLPAFTFAAGTTLVNAADATTPKDFTSPVSYQVTDGNKTATYTVTVTKAPASKLCSMETFTIPNQVGASQFKPASGGAKDSIIVTMPYSTPSFNGLVPTYTISPLATSAPASAVAQNFTTPFTYVVTAEDVTKKTEYVVRVQRATPSAACVILSISGFATLEKIDFDPASNTYTVRVPSGTPVSSLSPAITFSNYSTNTGVPTNYTTPQTITVTAEDGTSKKVYTIKVLVDNVPPVLTLSKPKNGATNYGLAGMFTLVYSEPIKLGTGGSITISGAGVLGTVSVKDSIAKFPFSSLSKLTTYTLTIPSGAFTDVFGNPCAASTISFTTANDVLPKDSLAYASYMKGESFDVPAFISGQDGTVKYDPYADVKATTTTQYGAYVIPFGKKLTIKVENVDSISILASFYARGGNRSYTITTNADPLLVSTGGIPNYDNNGDTLALRYIKSTLNPTEIYITNTSATGDIYVPYVYISKLGEAVIDEKTMYCRSTVNP